MSFDLLDATLLERIAKRLKIWFERYLEKNLKPLMNARRSELSGAAKGLIFQLAENLGSLSRLAAIEQIEALKKDDRKRLKTMGIVIGRSSIYFPGLLKPAPTRTLGLLWILWNNPDTTPEKAHPGRVSLPSKDFPAEYLKAIGYRPAGRLALRLDILERIAAHAWRLGRKGAFLADTHFLSLAGCGIKDLEPIMKEIGFRKAKETDEGVYFAIQRKRPKPPVQKKDGQPAKPKRTRKAKPRKEPEIDPHSPFAKLKELTLHR